MPEVCLETGKIVEINEGKIVSRVGSQLLVAGIVDDAPADANGTDGWNVANRVFERVDQRRPFGGREIGARLHENEMGDHVVNPASAAIRGFVVCALARTIAVGTPVGGRAVRAERPPMLAGGTVAPRPRLSGRPGRVAIAPRRGVALGPGALGSVLLLESIARIFVGAAGPPVGTAPVAGELRLSPRRHLRLRGIPQLAPSEPPHDDVLVRAFQLRERRQQLLLVA